MSPSTAESSESTPPTPTTLTWKQKLALGGKVLYGIVAVVLSMICLHNFQAWGLIAPAVFITIAVAVAIMFSDNKAKWVFGLTALTVVGLLGYFGSWGLAIGIGVIAILGMVASAAATSWQVKGTAEKPRAPGKNLGKITLLAFAALALVYTGVALLLSLLGFWVIAITVLGIVGAVAAYFIVQALRSGNGTPTTTPSSSSGRRSRVPRPAIKRPGKRTQYISTAVLAGLALLIVGGLVGSKVFSSNGQVVTAGVSQEQVTEQINAALDKAAEDAKAAQDKVKADADAAIAKANEERDAAKAEADAARAIPASGPKVQLINNSTSQVDLVRAALATRGVNPANMRFNGDIDQALARSIAPGGGVFGPTVLSGNELVSWILTGEPGALALKDYLLKCTSATEAEILDPKNYVAVQVMEMLQWNQNLSYANGVVSNSGNSTDPAGAVAIFFVGHKELETKSQSLCGVRAHCLNPQGQMPSAPNYVTVDRPIGGGHYTPPPVTPPTPPTGGCDQPNNCLPPTPPCEVNCGPPPVCTENCGPPPCEVDCTPPPCTENCVPPCEENPEGPGCTPPPCEENCTPPCEENPEAPECQPPPTCEDTPEAPECLPEPVKCDNVGADGICGTPDDGGEQQPVDGNGGLDAPTEGYTPEDAEGTIGNQPHCGNGVVCGTTPTEDGTVVDGSENGGLAPGGAVDVPVVGDNGAGGVNPGADGTAPSTNPDLGTAAPEDTPISNDTVGSDSANWDSGFSLPGITPAPAPVVESNYVAPAPAAPTYVEPAQQTGATQQVNDEPATVSSFSEPADDSSFSADTSDQSSTLATVTDITSASSHSSSTLDDSTSSSSSGASSFNSDSGSASDSTSSIDDSLMGAA